MSGFGASSLTDVDPDLHARAKALFLAASERPPEERRAFLDRQCAANDLLRVEVESLLAFFDERLDSRTGPAGTSAAAGRRIGNYRLLRKIGEGGMGEVWEAEQERPLQRRVALKILREQLVSDEILTRFDAERQALARMEHPNIATVFDAGADRDGRPYFVMELVAGLPITDFCERNGIGLRERLALFVTVCRGVAHAHGRGVVHRDIKPPNLLVAAVDGEPLAKVIDFGVAKAIGGPLTERALVSEPGRFIGTPEYMSPEQAEGSGADIDGRSDVYSLGVVLYELLVGCRPFDPPERSSDFLELRRRLLEDEPSKPSDRARSRPNGAQLATCLRGDLDRILLTALAKDRRRRYGTPGELAADIARHLDGLPIRARPGQRWRHPRQRSRRRWTLAGALALALVVAAGTVLWPRFSRRTAAPSPAIELGVSSPSIAVLPFDNLSGDQADAYFGDGLAEEVLNALAQIEGLRVAARTSSFAFEGRKEDVRRIGTQLNVGVVLEGSVRRSGDRLRITTQLIDTASGLHLWSKVFDRPSGEVFAIQDEIAHAVASALEIELRRAASTASVAGRAGVYDAYLWGRAALRAGSPQQLAVAIGLFEDVLATDPRFALALTGLAESKILLARRGDLPMERADAEAGTALEQALVLEPELAEAHAALGLLRSAIGDPSGAETALRRAIALNGNLAVAHLRLGGALAAQERRDEAEDAYGNALELDPLNVAVHHAIARNAMNAGRYDDGLLRLEQWLRVEPDSAETYRLMALYARTFGHLDAAVRWARRAVALEPEAPLNVNELIMAHSSLGAFDQADKWMEHAIRLAPSNHWTFTLRAFQLLERGAIDQLEAFMQDELIRNPVPDTDPLEQIARVRLALAARSKVYQGDFPSAVALFERALGSPFTSILEIGFDANAFVFLAFAYQKLGADTRAKDAMERALAMVHGRQDWIWSHLIMADTLAALYALGGREEQAVATLEKAFEDGWVVGYGALRFSPCFERLRGRDDFERLLGRVETRLDVLRARLGSS